MPNSPSDISQFLYLLIESDFSRRLFGPDFQSYGDFCTYFDTHFHQQHDIHSVWKSKGQNRHAWSVADFQALYVACWIYKPMEKGTYFLRMTSSEAASVRTGFEKLPTRKSSHLSKSGRSAHSGWKFLVGYEELLVQWQETNDRTYLMLKAEGHTTGIGSLYPHLKSWNHKRKTGAGLQANADLNRLATSIHTPIIARGAENFSNAYKAFLKDLGKKRREGSTTASSLKAVRDAKATCTVRDMLNVLTMSRNGEWSQKTNREVREKLMALAQKPQETTYGAYVNVDIAPEIKTQFSRFAQLFLDENRPNAVYNRYFEEVHVNPDQLSNAIRDFMTWDLPDSLRAQTQRRSRMLNF
ncbi:hypothetical protein SAMN04487965_0399 [Microbulbifer donghaiensis]|uniref:Uncharacterized protein n=1 Tax=Microbulbifer donghaiensis TaxID=494016 RepID=A0A1M4VDZ6_9GAMM|nr:hypothetical protein [Microbulbifer donghaiensis]SHE67128.1 hypothetical protein SAMN04487965_0399 [Microbulbifer donghaiensis]